MRGIPAPCSPSPPSAPTPWASAPLLSLLAPSSAPPSLSPFSLMCTMHDNLQNTLHDTYLLTVSPSSPSGHRRFARCVHSPRRIFRRGWPCRSWGTWWGTLPWHLSLGFFVSCPTCVRPRLTARAACHASVQAVVTWRARCTTRCAASPSVPVPSLAPFPCPSPFVCPLCSSPVLSTLFLSLTRTVHSNLRGTCSLRRPPACPHPSLCSGRVPPPSPSLLARTVQSNVCGTPVLSFHSPSPLLPLGPLWSPGPLLLLACRSTLLSLPCSFSRMTLCRTLCRQFACMLHGTHLAHQLCPWR